MPVEELARAIDRDELSTALHELLRTTAARCRRTGATCSSEFRLVHVARKVVGVGSVGTRAWILLLLGRDDDDPLFLQAKEAEASVLEEFVGHERLRQPRRAGGRRPAPDAGGQRHLPRVASGRPGLDGVTRDFYVRQLRDWKGSFDIEGSIPAGLSSYAAVCAQALARAHAPRRRIAIASYLGNRGTFDQAIASFAETYADQNQRDYNELKKAVADGRVRAETGL